MNRSHVCAGMLASILAFPAGTTAYAQVYKWVDARGQVNYSNQLPEDPKLAGRAAVVENRVSVYTPDAALMNEIEANRLERIKLAAAGKTEVWRPAVTMLGGTPAPVALTAYEPPVVEYPYWVGGGYHKPHHRPLSSKRQSDLQPGAIAGTIVGMNGYIPGSTVAVPGTLPPTSTHSVAHRAPRPAPLPSRER